MNKIVSGLSVLTVAALLVTSCGKEQPKTTAATVTTSTGTSDGAIVFINSDSLLNNYEYYKDFKASMEEKTKRAQADLTSKKNAFQREVNEYQQTAQTLSAEQRAATEERLGRKGRELQTLEQNASSALSSESAAENEKIYDKLTTYLKTFSKTKGYKYVLTFSKTNPSILYAEDGLDVSKDVIAGLNEEYKKEKK